MSKKQMRKKEKTKNLANRKRQMKKSNNIHNTKMILTKRTVFSHSGPSVKECNVGKSFATLPKQQIETKRMRKKIKKKKYELLLQLESDKWVIFLLLQFILHGIFFISFTPFALLKKTVSNLPTVRQDLQIF